MLVLVDDVYCLDGMCVLVCKFDVESVLVDVCSVYVCGDCVVFVVMFVYV